MSGVLGVCGRLQLALQGKADAETLEQLDWVCTSHIRSRYVDQDLEEGEVKASIAKFPLLTATPESLQPATYVHLLLADLAKKYAALRGKKHPAGQP